MSAAVPRRFIPLSAYHGKAGVVGTGKCSGTGRSSVLSAGVLLVSGFSPTAKVVSCPGQTALQAEMDSPGAGGFKKTTTHTVNRVETDFINGVPVAAKGGQTKVSSETTGGAPGFPEGFGWEDGHRIFDNIRGERANLHPEEAHELLLKYSGIDFGSAKGTVRQASGTTETNHGGVKQKTVTVVEETDLISENGGMFNEHGIGNSMFHRNGQGNDSLNFIEREKSSVPGRTSSHYKEETKTSSEHSDRAFGSGPGKNHFRQTSTEHLGEGSGGRSGKSSPGWTRQSTESTTDHTDGGSLGNLGKTSRIYNEETTKSMKNSDGRVKNSLGNSSSFRRVTTTTTTTGEYGGSPGVNTVGWTLKDRTDVGSGGKPTVPGWTKQTVETTTEHTDRGTGRRPSAVPGWTKQTTETTTEQTERGAERRPSAVPGWTKQTTETTTEHTDRGYGNNYGRKSSMTKETATEKFDKVLNDMQSNKATRVNAESEEARLLKHLGIGKQPQGSKMNGWSEEDKLRITQLNGELGHDTEIFDDWRSEITSVGCYDVIPSPDDPVWSPKHKHIDASPNKFTSRVTPTRLYFIMKNGSEVPENTKVIWTREAAEQRAKADQTQIDGGRNTKKGDGSLTTTTTTEITDDPSEGEKETALAFNEQFRELLKNLKGDDNDKLIFNSMNSAIQSVYVNDKTSSTICAKYPVEINGNICFCRVKKDCLYWIPVGNEIEPPKGFSLAWVRSKQKTAHKLEDRVQEADVVTAVSTHFPGEGGAEGIYVVPVVTVPKDNKGKGRYTWRRDEIPVCTDLEAKQFAKDGYGKAIQMKAVMQLFSSTERQFDLQKKSGDAFVVLLAVKFLPAGLVGKTVYKITGGQVINQDPNSASRLYAAEMAAKQAAESKNKKEMSTQQM